MNILLCGDFAQLPPVAAVAMYSTPKPKANAEVHAGKVGYNAFTKTILLDENMRAQGTIPEAIQFRNVLGELRNGPLSLPSWTFLTARLESKLSDSERASFDGALHLYIKKREVNVYNEKRLRSLGNPVIKIHALNSSDKCKKVDADDAGHLENELLLSKEARVMLTYNFNIAEGLVNGTMGTVQSVLWDNEVDDLLATAPALILVEFDGYKGHLGYDYHGKWLVPVYQRTQQVELKDNRIG